MFIQQTLSGAPTFTFTTSFRALLKLDAISFGCLIASLCRQDVHESSVANKRKLPGPHAFSYSFDSVIGLLTVLAGRGSKLQSAASEGE